jgi:hypothetical protein
MRSAEKHDHPAEEARKIIDADKAKHDAKRARLKQARLDREAADLLAHAPGKPREKALNAKAPQKPKGGR